MVVGPGYVDLQAVIIACGTILIEKLDYRRFHECCRLPANSSGAGSSHKLSNWNIGALHVRGMDQGDVGACIHQEADGRFGHKPWKEQSRVNLRAPSIIELAYDHSVRFRD